MRILHLMQCTNLGGMEQTTLERIRGLQKLGHDCQVLSLNPVGRLGELLKESSIPARGLTYRGRGGWRSFPRLRQQIRASSVDAVLMTGHNFGATLALGDRAIKRRVLSIHFHHQGVCPDWQWKIIYRAARRQFQAITFATNFIREEAEGIYPPIAELAVTLPNPFSVPTLPSVSDRKEVRRELGIAEDAFVIGNAGWLIHRKRFDVLLRVMKEVHQQDPSTLCLVAGDGPLKPELVSLSKELGISDQVKWLGWQKDLRKFYLALDALVFNSDWDALGRTPIEALAYGTPVVASVLKGGLTEVISDERYGFVTDSHDVPWMAAKLLLLRGDAVLSGSITAAARTRIADICCPVEDARKLSRLLCID